MNVDLRVDWCDHKAAEYAVTHWHYSKTMPSGKLVKVGAWEDGKFIGVVMFGRGAIYNIGEPYGLTQMEVCELVRVALSKHVSPVSQIASKAIKMLQKESPGTRLIVSYADSGKGHAGGIYQAMNWVYVGVASGDKWISVKGKAMHPRSLYSKFGTRSIDFIRNKVDASASFVDALPKHKYLYPLDRAMRKQIAPLAKPYPKRETCEQSVEGDTVGDQPTEEGSIPSVRSDYSSTEIN